MSPTQLHGEVYRVSQVRARNLYVNNNTRASRRGGWVRGRVGTSETPPEPLPRREGHRAAFNGLEGYYCLHVKGKSRGMSETPHLPVTVSKLMTCERKYAFEPCCMLFASLLRGLLRIIRCRSHFVFYQGVGLFKRPVSCYGFFRKRARVTEGATTSSSDQASGGCKLAILKL